MYLKPRREGCVLKKLVEKGLENLSTKEVLLFRICCASCGQAYGNQPIRFSKAGVDPITERNRILYNALYEQELHTVRQVAIGSAAEQMNLCPICERLVCNRCFMICGELDMCKQCAAELQQQGQLVAPGIVETTSC